MKNWLIYCFVFLLVFYQLKDGFIVVGFKMNQQYIAENFCENIDKPELHCNGQCVFMKAINESHKNDNQFPALNLGGKFSFFTAQDFTSFVFEKLLFDKTRSIFIYFPFNSQDFFDTLFRPPIC